MKLRLFDVDFEEETIAFKVPSSVMETARFKAGSYDVDLSGILESANEPGVQGDAENRCPACLQAQNATCENRKNGVCMDRTP